VRPAGRGTVNPVGQVTLGGVSSTIVTVNEQSTSLAEVHVTVVEPTANTDPEGGEQVTAPHPLEVGEKVTTLAQEVAVGNVPRNISDGHVRLQLGEKTLVVETAELLPRVGSPDMPLIIAVFVIVEPGAALTFTTRVIDVDPVVERGPRLQVTVPVPPGGGVEQLPGLDNETNVVPVGITLVKVAPESESGPLLVTVIR